MAAVSRSFISFSAKIQKILFTVIGSAPQPSVGP
jgi:hypothetical protein